MKRSIRSIRKSLGVLAALGLSLVAVKGLSLTLPENREITSFQRVSPRSALWVILFLFIFVSLTSFSKKVTGEGEKTAAVITLFYSFWYILGYFFKIWKKITVFWTGLNDTVNFISWVIGIVLLIYSLVIVLFTVLDGQTAENADGRLCSSTGRLFVISMLVLLLCWAPWFLQKAPLITSSDSENQIAQAAGTIPLLDNHPIFHTMILRVMFILGGSTQTGALLYSVFQLLFCAAVYSCTICFIDRVFHRHTVTLVSILWFALFPIYPLYGMTMWKDIPFSVCVTLLVLNICMLRVADPAKHRRILIWNAVICLFICFLRLNGFLIFIPTAAALALKYKAERKTYVPLCAGFLAFYLFFQFCGLYLLGIEKWRSSEGFSIPLQQIARVAAYDPDSITDEQKEVMARYFDKDPAAIYNPQLSNNVKFSFREDAFAEDKMPMVRLWWELGKTHPRMYLESILHNSYGYSYPETEKNQLAFKLHYEGFCYIYSTPLIHSALLDKVQNYLEGLEHYKMPVLAWMLNPAFGTWLLFFALQYGKYRRSKFTIAHLPLISLWIQMLGSPAYCELRYVFSFFTTLPLLLSCGLLPVCHPLEEEE